MVTISTQDPNRGDGVAIYIPCNDKSLETTDPENENSTFADRQ